ncbi:MAG TPA: hypothetical protein VHP56_09855 [Solirubrobacterales bacterium]|jgi:hypothetical protein|nr:hypothetical protein [Solirubrobacterales bacterium]
MIRRNYKAAADLSRQERDDLEEEGIRDLEFVFPGDSDPPVGVVENEKWLPVMGAEDFYEPGRPFDCGARLLVHELLGTASDLCGDSGVEEELGRAYRELLAAFSPLRADLICCRPV